MLTVFVLRKIFTSFKIFFFLFFFRLQVSARSVYYLYIRCYDNMCITISGNACNPSGRSGQSATDLSERRLCMWWLINSYSSLCWVFMLTINPDIIMATRKLPVLEKCLLCLWLCLVQTPALCLVQTPALDPNTWVERHERSLAWCGRILWTPLRSTRPRRFHLVILWSICKCRVVFVGHN